MSFDAARLAADSCHLNSGCGFPAPSADIFQFTPLVKFHFLGVTWSIDKPIILMAIGVVAILGFFFAAFTRPKLVPRGVQNLAELGYLFVRDQIARDVIGKKADKFVPFLVSLFFFVWIMNFMSIVPGAQFPVTSKLAFPVGLALIVWVMFNYIGIKNQGVGGYFKNMVFPPGVPEAMYVILTPIELFSTILVRPFTLAIRLFANMFAGHLLIATFSIGGLVPALTEPRCARSPGRRSS